MYTIISLIIFLILFENTFSNNNIILFYIIDIVCLNKKIVTYIVKKINKWI